MSKYVEICLNMSKLVPSSCAGLFNDYLDADGPDGADGPEECDQPPSASAKRHRQSLQQSASSLLSAGPSSASPRPGPAGGGQSQGHGPTGKTATGMDVRKMTWLAGATVWGSPVLLFRMLNLPCPHVPPRLLLDGERTSTVTWRPCRKKLPVIRTPSGRLGGSA